MSAPDYRAPESVGRLQQRAFFVGGVALLVAIFGWLRFPDAFYRSYLMSYMLVLGFGLGSLGLLMLQHLTSGQWGILIRRPAESATRTIPILLVLFVPILFGMKSLYFRWLDPAETRNAPLSAMQQWYFTSQNFKIRAAIYFAILLLLMFIFSAWSRKQDVNKEDRLLRRRLKMVAGPGIILYVFVMSLAAIDWVMSISPHWASTIYGFLFVAGQLISSLSLMIAIVVMLASTGPLASILKPRHLHDLAKLLFAFNMLWAYFGFSQLLIIWAGNQPEEITFFHSRLYGSWGLVAVIVLVFHFFVPFFVLLPQDVKRSTRWMPRIAVWMIFMRLVDLFWLTRPEFSLGGVQFTWLDLVVPVALIGLWLGFFAWNLQREPLLPLGDPKLAEVIAPHEH
jgi:multisubunit Na+/H+ antiporter MnhG subunit